MDRISLQCSQAESSVPGVLHDELWLHWELDPPFKLVVDVRSEM